MKRVFKILLVLLCILATLVVAMLITIGTGYVMYRNVVRQTPGGLKPAVLPGDIGKEVNVFAGTGGIFYISPYDTPAAATPFGMVRLAPDTASLFINKTALNAAGYYYPDNKIIGFSHNRLVGADAEEGGNFRIIPTVASSAAKAREEGQFAKFTHKRETASPGYYAVDMHGLGIRADLTATPRVGIHRYTFKGGEAPHLLLDVTSVLGDRKVADGLVWLYPDKCEIEGSVTTFGSFGGRYGGLRVHFAARVDQPFAEYGILSGKTFRPKDVMAAGDHIVVDLGFAANPPKQVIEVRLGLSYVSIENAHENLDTEAGKGTFEELAAKARDDWEKCLSKARIEGGTTDQRAIFTSALYRSFLMPTTFCDVNGEYMGFDKAVHKAEGFRYYTDFSLWDTFRTLHPLYNLVARDEQRDMLKSLTDMAVRGGGLPRWPSGCGFTGCMFGSPANMVIAESYLKGIRDFDVEAAYAAMCRTARGQTPAGADPRNGIENYLAAGYIADETMSKSVACTLEYAYADDALSRLATALGKTDDAKEFKIHSQFYRNLWDPQTQYFRSKNQLGVFNKELKPTLLTYQEDAIGGDLARGYCEGSANQWRWAVPFDTEGLMALFKSKDYFVQELNAFFEGNTATMGAWYPGGCYWQGNEPDLHSAYLFNDAGRPDLTQKWARWALDTRYANNYIGLDGNDDGSTLSAWYVFTALGFYPQAGSDRYWLGSPLFPKATLDLGGGKTLTIIADNAAPENIYVKSVRINGKTLDRWWCTHEEIAQGGFLEFEMSGKP